MIAIEIVKQKEQLTVKLAPQGMWKLQVELFGIQALHHLIHRLHVQLVVQGDSQESLWNSYLLPLASKEELLFVELECFVEWKLDDLMSFFVYLKPWNLMLKLKATKLMESDDPNL